MAISAFPLMAVDVGNRRIKFGWFAHPGVGRSSRECIPEPQATFSLPSNQADFGPLEAWWESVCQSAGESQNKSQKQSNVTPPENLKETSASEKATWWIGSVNRRGSARLIHWLETQHPDCRVVWLRPEHLPLRVGVAQPERVGMDRLLDALTANTLRTPGRPAVVVDVGSAITVDWLSDEGTFCGGAILPGLEMSARALHQFTDLLPEVSFHLASEPPPVLGTHTEAAIRSGLFWGAVGAIGELATRLAQLASTPPQIFLTGGAASLLAPYLVPKVQYLPHLTLAGIALTALAADSAGADSRGTNRHEKGAE